MGFTHLHVHGEHSLLDGMNKLPELVKKVKDMGQTSLALTDHGVCYGLVWFYNECVSQGIKPILGCEVYEAPESRFTKAPVDGENYYHLILLVKNEVGYRNLCKLVTRSNTEGFYHKPRIDMELLTECHEGLVCLSACLAGRIPTDIEKGNLEKAREDILRYRELFGEDFYLEIQNHGIREEAIVAQELVKFSNELNIKLVCTNDCHYLNSEDAEAHEWLMCVQTGKKITDDDRMIYTGDYSVKSEEEMRLLFPSLSEAFDNTMEVADKCNFKFEFAHSPADYRMPKVHIPEEYGSDYYRYLEHITFEGLDERYPEGHEERDRAIEDVKYELSVIKNMGFAEYFLDTLKTIKWSRENGILVGPGRGSGAGSRVNYCIGITDIDPIKYGLLFERFLNPERISMPDIDVDYQYSRKDDVIRFEAESNGTDKFCKIQTLGSMLAKGIIRDCTRVAGYEPAVGNRIAKMIPGDPKITLNRAMDENPELREYIENADEGLKKVWRIALKLEGLKKSAGTHACGHIPTPVPCEELFPCGVDKDTGYLICQYDMVEAEHLGNLKKDLLMLRNLTVIDEAHMEIKKLYGKEIPLWNEEILSDTEALHQFWTGDTTGIFQFESEGMRKFMKNLKPDCFEDIIAGVSLYRPGPMDYIPKYVEGKHNPSSITYDCPELEPILNGTYGVIVYQEQVMAIVRELAGFSMGRADLIRKAMGKKKQDIIDAERQNFVYGNEELSIQGCVKRGISEKVANKIYDDMSEFAKYAFNKSHAAAYAAISMQTAYLRAHYPVEFMAALITSVSDNTEKMAEYIYTCKQMNIKMLPPDVNESVSKFTVSDGCIRYSLSALKGLGDSVVNAIVEEREQNGKYRDLRDFMTRLGSKEVNKRTLENFIKAGAFDSLGGKRRQYMLIYSQMLDEVMREKKESLTGQMSLFDFVDEDTKKSMQTALPNVEEYTKEEILNFEKEVIGLYISGHPLDMYEGLLKKNVTATTPDFIFDEETGETKVVDGEPKVIGGIITEVKTKTTRNNTLMAFLTVEDVFGTVEVIVFPRDFERLRGSIREDRKVLINGRVSVEDDKDSKLILADIMDIEEVPRDLWIKYNDKESFDSDEDGLYELLKDYDGSDSVVIYCEKEHIMKRLPPSLGVGICDDMLERLTARYGKEAVKIADKAVTWKGAGYGRR